MSDIQFALGTFSVSGSSSFVALVLNDDVLSVADAVAATGGAPLPGDEMIALLRDWDRHFDRLCEISSVLFGPGSDRGRVAGTLQSFSKLSVHAPIPRPPKILNSAANYSGHLAEMRSYTQSGGDIDPNKIFKGDKSAARPYLFLKAPSSVTGPFDDIILPSAEDQIDWEAELALVIGRTGRRIKSETALDHVAGYMTFNDVSCRNRLFREDRPNFRTDWLSSKSFDSFAPAGPLLVPRAFVPDTAHLHLTLSVNGETKQEGFAGDMIYSPEEQIEYASAMMTLDPGDIFATGTTGGVGQGTGVFLKPGDVVEAEIEGLGRQRNRVVLDPAADSRDPLIEK